MKKNCHRAFFCAPAAIITAQAQTSAIIRPRVRQPNGWNWRYPAAAVRRNELAKSIKFRRFC